MEGTAGIGVRPDLGFIGGNPKQLLIRALWAGPKVASSPRFVASSCQHVPSAVSQQTSRVTEVQGRFGLAAKTLNVKPSSQQAWLCRAEFPGSPCGMPVSLWHQLRMHSPPPPPPPGICCLKSRPLHPQPLQPALTLKPLPQPGAEYSLQPLVIPT